MARELISCSDDLDGLRRFAEDASEHARAVHNARRSLDSCRSFSSTTNDCSLDESRLESATRSFRMEMLDFGRKVRDVEISCGYDIAPRSQPPRVPK